MTTLATLESVELHDVDQLNSVSTDWKIESLHLRLGLHRYYHQRNVFSEFDSGTLSV